MPDAKISALTAITALTDDDLLVVVDAATVTNKITVANAKAGLQRDLSPLRPMTGEPNLVSGTYSSVAVSNRCYWARVIYGTTLTISKVGCFINVSSGNMKVGVYSDSSGAPGARKAVSASTAVGTANTYQEIALGSSVSCGPGDWLCIVADNTTATFGVMAANAIVQWTTGNTDLNRYVDSSFSPADPAPATASDVNRHFHLIGVV